MEALQGPAPGGLGPASPEADGGGCCPPPLPTKVPGEGGSCWEGLGATWRADPSLKGSLGSVWSEDTTRMLHRLLPAADLPGRWGESCGQRRMRKDFKALGWFMKESGVRFFFSSPLLLWGGDVGLNIKIQSLKALAM